MNGKIENITIDKNVSNKVDYNNDNVIFSNMDLDIKINNDDNCNIVKKGFIIDGCINRNAISSILFIIPAIYSYLISWFIVSTGSIICLFTSIINHYNMSQHKIYRPLDIICVNSIAIYFVFFTIFTVGISFYSNIMYFLCFITVGTYLYIRINPYLYKKYYCLVHIFAVTGIIFCIKSYDTHLKNQRDNKNYENNKSGCHDNGNDSGNDSGNVKVKLDLQLRNIT